MSKELTKVIFRKYPDGDIIALFPQIAADNRGFHCQSYMHIGQHGAAEPSCVIRQTKPATPNEYHQLSLELVRIGYHLKITRRFSCKDYEVRKEIII